MTKVSSTKKTELNTRYPANLVGSTRKITGTVPVLDEDFLILNDCQTTGLDFLRCLNLFFRRPCKKEILPIRKNVGNFYLSCIREWLLSKMPKWRSHEWMAFGAHPGQNNHANPRAPEARARKFQGFTTIYKQNCTIFDLFSCPNVLLTVGNFAPSRASEDDKKSPLSALDKGREVLPLQD